MVDDEVIREFVEDDLVFNDVVDGLFNLLDADHDARLSYSELLNGLKNMRVLKEEEEYSGDESEDELRAVYDDLFAMFDHDGSGKVTREAFREELKKMMLAIADQLAFLPMAMVLEEGSLLKMAVVRRSSKLLASN